MYINYIELLFCILRGLHMSNISSAINRVKFDEISNKIANYLKNYRGENKITIEYHLDSKLLFAGIF